MIRRWIPCVLYLVAAAASVAAGLPDHLILFALAAVMGVIGVMVSPLFYPRSPGDAEGRRRADSAGVPLIYWRANCTYCLRLRFALGPTGNRAVWVEVAGDPEASARVRAANGGDETVPTVFVGDVGRTNPDPRWVRQQLSAG